LGETPAAGGHAAFVLEAWPWPGAKTDEFVWEPLAGDGSDRRFIRVRAGGRTALLVIGPDPAENRSYAEIGRHLWALERIGPEFYRADAKLGLFLIEDLGDLSLHEAARQAAAPDLVRLYRRVLELMVRLHGRGLNGFDPGWCYQTPRYDRELILTREAGYFAREFLEGYLGRGPAGGDLFGEFEDLARAALAGGRTTLMHRDFQSRNVMFSQGRPRMIDFQGARLGPPGYDLASLLYDPYVDLTEALRQDLLEHYLALSQAAGPFDRPAFLDTYPFLAVCRLLQALGAFGFLTRRKNKPHFARYIPAALRALNQLLEQDTMSFLPGLSAVVRDLRPEILPGDEVRS